LIATLGACQGAVVTFAPAQGITGDADVATHGTPVYAYSLGSATLGTGTHTVNGVDFVGIDPGANAAGTVSVGSLSFVNWNYGIHSSVFGSASAPFSTLSSDYKTILQSAKFDGRTLNGTEGVKVILNGLVEGEDYQVQLWSNVSLAQIRTMSWIGDGGTTGTLTDNSTGSDGGVGQYMIGTFAASGTSQDLNLSNTSDGFGKINALSLRMISTPVLFENGDFETGNYTSWTNTAGATIDSATPLAGLYSAALRTGSGEIAQTFTAQSGVVTTDFSFYMADPGSGGEQRGLQLMLREEVGIGQINLQVVDLDNDGDGDVQIYNQNAAAGSTGWQTVLTDAVVFSSANTLSLTFNAFSVIFDYTLTVNGSTVTGLSFWQNGVMDDYSKLAFLNQYSAIGYTVDSVQIAVIPDPEVSIWDHVNASVDLKEERGVSTTFTGSGASKEMRIDVIAPDANRGLAWATLQPPAGGWDFGDWREVSATIENVSSGVAAVDVILWIVGGSGWSAVSDIETLNVGETHTFTCALRSDFPDATPKIDPGNISEIRVMLQDTATTDSSLIVSAMKVVGSVPVAWQRPVDRIDVPNMENGAPQAGKRVLYQLPGDEATDIYVALYLPTDWEAGLIYPVIAEYPGNIFYQSQGWSIGRPEQCMIGYGVSQGVGAIWVSLPFIDRNIGVGEIAENGFGNTDDTTQYAKDVIAHLIANYGGDANNLFLSGFSRGAIACGYIGLRDATIGAFWKGLIPCQHYDGSAWNESNMAGALTRAPNFTGESIFQTDNSESTYGALMDATAGTEFWADSALGFHDPAMFLDDRLSTQQVRSWFRELVDGTLLVDEDMDAGKGAWSVFAQSGKSSFEGGAMKLSSWDNYQPASAYFDFPDVTLKDGHTLSLSVDISTTRTEARASDIRFGLGFADPAITVDPASVLVSLSGYSCWIPSAGDASDVFVIRVDAAGGPANFFNSGTSPGAMAVATTSAVGTTSVPCMFQITRRGDELVFSGSIDGNTYESMVVATGADVFSDFKYNTIALGYAWSPSDFVSYDNVRLELIPAGIQKTEYDFWSNDHSLTGGPDDDDDADRVTNLYEYGLGGDPRDANDLGYPIQSGITEIESSDWFIFTHPQLSDTESGILYVLELSEDLENWQSGGSEIYNTSSDGHDVGVNQVSHRISMIGQPQRFIRLIVETN
jgi:hypothetical protein